MTLPHSSLGPQMYKRFWIIICGLLLTISTVSSILVYVQVSHELTNQMNQRLYWEAKFYREQLDQIFLRAALRLDNLIMSTSAISGNRELLQNELQLMNNSLPSLTRSWLAYPDGILIPSPSTRPDHVLKLMWWREFLQGHSPKISGYPMGRSQAMVGKPFLDQTGMSPLVPLFSLDLHSFKIRRAAGLELDINQALVDNKGVDIDWTNEPVSIYTASGYLLASPYHYSTGNFKMLMRKDNSPLIRQMLLQPDNSFGFKLYYRDHQKIVGIYLHDPSLGMVIVVERPAAEVINPMRHIAAGPLVVAILSLIIATLFAAMLYTSLRRIREAQQMTRTAEFRALQAHINPHFLFNTLDHMAGFAVMSGNTALVEMIRSLANIFRYTTRNLSAIVSLREELNYLNEYIKLQQIRFSGRFTFHLTVPEDLLSTQVLKFCIQPLVENCFRHGVEKSLDPIAIIVTVVPIQENIIEIQVSDDGPGITDKRLAEVRASLQGEHLDLENRCDSVGIANIHYRIRYTYGSSYGIILEPLNPGLVVRLRIPRRTF
ncbi:MAG TPA: hypothetical protein DDW50_18645 [Firmicutes bacterium]|jgi:hypothetical protein|nr:hypothetical protein [Bacillota bacterium]